MITCKRIVALDKTMVALMANKYKNTKKSHYRARIESINQKLRLDNLYNISEPNSCFRRMKETLSKMLRFFTKLIFNKVIGISTVLSISSFTISDYISRQRYYDELIDKYLTSMENLLIKDKLHITYLEREHLEKEKNQNADKNKEFQQKDAEYNQVKSLALVVTENTLRSLSKDDGICLPKNPFEIHFCLPGTKHNLERQQLLLSFLDDSELGFKNRYTGAIPKEPSQSFLVKINLGFLTGTDGINLEKIDLSRAILRHANFKQANLREARLIDTDLRNAYMEFAKLYDAYLIHADLRDAYLQCAKLTGAHLMTADLRNAKLSGAHLMNADLTDAKLSGADFTYANLKGAKGAAINQAKLCNTILPSGKVSDCPKKVSEVSCKLVKED